MPLTKFCIYQRDIANQNEERYGCMHTERNNAIPSYVCPFKTGQHAEYSCHYYIQLPVCKNPSIEERLDKLEQVIKCLQVILKGE